MKQNGLKAWILAARPKTLTGAIAPVIVGCALAYSDSQFSIIQLIPFCLCLLFAILMQIDANLVNDYFDWKKGTDRGDRLGPERACAQGWITPSAIKKALWLVSTLACFIGLPLICYGGLILVFVGVLCVVFCFLYTTCLSYKGLGDVLVLLFFGIVPVGFTYYVMTEGRWTLELTLLALAQGMVTDCLLMVNNYRDLEQDMISGKKTLVVRFGKSFGQMAYLLLGLIAVSLVSIAVISEGINPLYLIILLIYILLHILLYKQMIRLEGKALNKLLGDTARNIFLFAILVAIVLILHRYSIYYLF